MLYNVLLWIIVCEINQIKADVCLVISWLIVQFMYRWIHLVDKHNYYIFLHNHWKEKQFLKQDNNQK